jgi:hypothetical protein
MIPAIVALRLHVVGCPDLHKARSLLEWAATHRAELREDWARSRAQLPLVPIAPLD